MPKKISDIKLNEKQLKKRSEDKFHKKIISTFTNAGFSYINTTKKHTNVGHRDIEIDSIFYYENIFLICEDTCGQKDKDHIRSKKEAFDEINENFITFYEWLNNSFPDHLDNLSKYEPNEIKIYYLYISQHELNITTDEQELYKNIKFISPEILEYFFTISECIKKSSRFEIFRFLGIKKDMIGIPKSDVDIKSIKAPIIYPKEIAGIGDDIRIVSFMMSADLLLKTSYVLRKDGWEKTGWPYQRLIVKEKIKNIRKFLADHGQTFYNNIIVGLPNTARFADANGNPVPLASINNYEKCNLILTEEWNSICIIDGQHRVFAHYEGDKRDKLETKIAPLRDKLHLLVTGLIFPEDMSQLKIAQKQSSIFCEINSNAKSVPPDVLLHIEMINNPYSDLGLARRVIDSLNHDDLFLNMFKLSNIGSGRIKVASIIKFALRNLVTLHPPDGKKSLFDFWEDEDMKRRLLNEDELALESYVEFCKKKLCIYFSALRDTFKNEWDDEDSMILSVVSINGFIIAYTKMLSKFGPKDFIFYRNRFNKLNINFSKSDFPYTASQYSKFSENIINGAFEDS